MLLRTDIVVKQQVRVSFSVRRLYYSSFELLPELCVIIGWRTFGFALLSGMK